MTGQTVGTFTGQTSAGGFDALVVQFAVSLPPIVGLISAPLDPVLVNTEALIAAEFVDPSSADIHTAVWDCGDGTLS